MAAGHEGRARRRRGADGRAADDGPGGGREEAGIGLVGGIIHRAEDGRRTSRALVFDGAGEVLATYEKLHLPEEPGFWETSHYEPGTEAPRRIDAFGMPIGIQICSDNNRPEGSHLLGAQGAGPSSSRAPPRRRRTSAGRSSSAPTR